MSKVVKGIGRAIGSVVKGVVKVVKTVAKSPLGRILLSVGATMIGAPMLAGALNGAAAGSGFLGTLSGALSGAAAGFNAAVGGIGSAIGTMASQGIGAGLSQLGSGMASNFGMGSVVDAGKNLMGMGGTLAAEAPNAGGVIGSHLTENIVEGGIASDPIALQGGGLVNGTIMGNPSITGGGLAPGVGDAIGGVASSAAKEIAARPGILDSVMQGVKDYRLGPSLVMMGGKMVAGGMQARAAEKMRQDELRRMYDSYKINWRVGDDGRFYSA